MANSTIPNLAAVTVPALTDLFGVRQSGDARDKKLTVTQLLTLVPSGGDVTKVGTPVDNQLPVWTGDGTIEGSTNFDVNGTLFQGKLGNGPGIVNINGVNILPRHGDPNTGLQNVGDDRLAMVAGGVAGITLIEASGGVLPTLQTNVGITAFATGGQTNATQLNSGYNVVDTVATTGDSVKFSSLVNVGSIVYVKNDGANALDLFPAGGDDLGLGVGVAISVAAGKSVAFLGSVISSTWTQLIFQEVAGGGDVTKVGTPANNQIGVWTGDGTIEGDANFLLTGTQLTLPTGSSAGLPELKIGSGQTGFFSSSSSQLRITVGGTERFTLTSNNFQGFLSGSGRMVNRVSSLTVPTFVPNTNDDNTGLGGNGSDSLALIAGGVEGIRVAEAEGNIVASFAGVLVGFANNSPELRNIAASNTVPTLIPNKANATSGIGQNAADQVSLIASGVELLRISDDAGAFMLAGTNAAADGGDLDLSSGDSGVAATGDGGAVNILAGESLATAGDGGAVSIKSGAGILSGAGGDFLLEVGSGGAAGPGTSGNFFVNTLTGADAAAGLQVPLPGLVSIYGIGRSGAGLAGNLELWGGYASGSGGGSIGGDVIIWGGGQGGGAGEGGNALLIGGESDTQPGDAEIRGGVATTGGSGGFARVLGGAGFGVNFGGGAIVLKGGLGIGTGNGGQANLTGGQSGSGATGAGGAVQITGGLSGATNGDGGDINILSGTGAGSGANGDITFGVGGTNIVYDEATDRLIQGAEIFAYQSEANVTKVGTPVDNQIGVWTGDGTIEGTTAFVQNANSIDTTLRYRTAFGSSGSPAHSFTGETNSGLFRQSSGVLMMSVLGTGSWVFRGTSFDSNIANGPRMMFEASSASNPVFIPRLADTDSGLGATGDDHINLIAGGLSCMSVRETAAARQIGFYTTAPISQQTGVAVSSAAIHAALVALGLITA